MPFLSVFLFDPFTGPLHNILYHVSGGVAPSAHGFCGWRSFGGCCFNTWHKWIDKEEIQQISGPLNAPHVKPCKIRWLKSFKVMSDSQGFLVVCEFFVAMFLPVYMCIYINRACVHRWKSQLIAHVRSFCFHIPKDWWNGNNLKAISHWFKQFWTWFILSTGLFHFCLGFGMCVSCSEGRKTLKHAVIIDMISKNKCTTSDVIRLST